MQAQTQTETLTYPAADAADTKRPPGAWPFLGCGRPRNGKIARLPWAIREELNERLRNGESGKSLTEWLNSQMKVRDILEGEYGFKPITEQNVSEWRQGDYQEWLAQQELLSEVGDVAGMAQGMAKQLSGWLGGSRATLGDHLATLLEMRYALFIKGWDGEVTPEVEKKLKVFRSLNRDIAQLRRGDHRAVKQGLSYELSEEQKLSLINQWMEESPKIKEKIHGAERPPLTPEERERRLRAIFGISEDWPLPGRSKGREVESAPGESESVQVNPSESDQIQPNPTESDSSPIAPKPDEVNQAKPPGWNGHEDGSPGVSDLLALKCDEFAKWARLERLRQQERLVRVQEQRFQRETAQLFLNWYEDRKAKEIAESNFDNSEKIEALGRLMFGENWDDPDPASMESEKP